MLQNYWLKSLSVLRCVLLQPKSANPLVASALPRVLGKGNMLETRRFFWRAVGIVGGLIALIIAIDLLLPAVVDLQSVKERVTAEISQKTGLDVQFSRFEVSLIPHPRVVIHNASLSFPREFNGIVESLTAYPKVFPLLLGDVKLARIQIESPEFNVNIPETLQDREKERPSISLEEIQRQLASLLTPFTLRAPGLHVTITGGGVDLKRGHDTAFRIEKLNSRLDISSSEVKLLLSCEASLWKQLNLDVKFDANGNRSELQLALDQFRPKELTDYLFPSEGIRLNASEASIRFILAGAGAEELKGNFQATIPALNFSSGAGEDHTLRGGLIHASFQRGGGQLSVELSDFTFEYPGLRVTGKLQHNPSPETPLTSLELEGTNIDVAPVRKVVLALGRENRTVRKIFDVLRAGHVPHITYSVRGKSPVDLKKARAMVIRGSLNAGEIFVPKVQLDVEQASGDVVISGGVLHGKNLVGTAGGSHGRNGSLTLALKRDENDDGPFVLDIDLDADLSQLPPILERVVKNDKFLKELSLLKDIRGRAQGKLLLGERLKSVKTKVEAREFNLSGNYERIPFPLELSGTGFLYESTLVSIKSLSGRVGASTFSNATTSVDWGKPSGLGIVLSEPALISLDVVYPWLTSYEKIKNALINVDSAKGAVKVSRLDLYGPLFKPREWRFQGAGSVDDLAIRSPFFPGQVDVKNGRFEVSHEKLQITNWKAEALDASLTVTGTVDHPFESNSQKDLAMDGALGPKGLEWVVNLIHLPPEFRPRAPLKVSQGHLVLGKSGEQKDFSGSITVNGSGAQVAISVHRTPERLSIDRLAIKDGASDASLSMSVGKKDLDISFDGALHSATLEKVLLRNEILSGYITGTMRTKIQTDGFMNSTANGSLELQGFQYLWTIRSPILIQNASIDAKESRLNVKSMAADLAGSRLDLSGTVDFSARGFRVDMDLESQILTWEAIKELLEKVRHSKKMNDGSSKGIKQGGWFQDTQLEGVIRVKSEQFAYDHYIWSPLRATVLLHRNITDITFTDAFLCGVSTLGTMSIGKDQVAVDIKFSAANRDLDPALTCFFDKKGMLSGTFSISGEIKGQGAPEDIKKNLQGGFQFHAEKGRIYRFGMVAKIFSLLNISEIYRGQLPDLVNEGCAYDRFVVSGKIGKGKIVLDDSTIDGSCVKMVWRGDIDLTEKKVNLTVLVAPLRTVDRVVGNIPLLGGILNGSLVSIPVAVSGDWRDPSVVPLSPSAVGAELLGYMKRTIQLPFRVIQPLF